jgi:hypothetical protein
MLIQRFLEISRSEMIFFSQLEHGRINFLDIGGKKELQDVDSTFSGNQQE